MAAGGKPAREVMQCGVLSPSLSHLGGKVADDISKISTPQGNGTLVSDGSGKAFTDSLVGFCKTT